VPLRRSSFYRIASAAFILCCLAISSSWANNGMFSWGKEPDFLDAAEVFTLRDIRQQEGQFIIQGHIADAYYVYRHSLKLVDEEGDTIDLALPPGELTHDEFFGNTEIYTGDAARLSFRSNTAAPVTLHWQGCAEAGICYPPQTIQIDLPTAATGISIPAGNPSAQKNAAGQEASETVAGRQSANPATAALQEGPAAALSSSPPGVAADAGLAEDQAAAQKLAALGPVSGALLFFGFGLLLAFTPCTLPMIPIVSTMVVGSQAKPRRALVLSLSYVLAMAATYAAVGVAAGLAGANLQATLQSPWLLGSFAALFIVLAVSLFGAFELRLPSALMNRLESAGRGRSGGSVAGAAGLGFLSALLVGPCMTAPLAGALLYIGQTGSALQGGLALFTLGLGMGLPLLAIAVFGARVLPRPGAWMERVRIAFGYVMMGMAVMMLTRFLPATLGLALWGAWILSVAIGLIAWGQALAGKRRLVWSLRSGAAFAGLWSVLMLVGAASGGNSPSQPLAHLQGAQATGVAAKPSYVPAKSVEDVNARLAEASGRGEWTLIDFYADWCVSCHVIERNVFGDPTVAARLAGMQVLRPDVTHNDATDKALLRHWGVMGPPTLILVGPDGTERRDLRVVGEIDAQGFLARLNAAGAS